MTDSTRPAVLPPRPMRLPIALAALVCGGLAIVMARHYERPEPQKEAPAPGMTVGSDTIALTGDAPMWNVIKLGPAEPAAPHWTDPVPARIVFDEARTSRIGSPLGGRVVAVAVERGQRVKVGDPLFSVSSPNLAELRADLEKAQIEGTTARLNFERVKALVDAGSLAAKEQLTAQQAVTEAELAARLAAQKLASLKVAGTGEAAFTVTAPRAGVVVEKNVAVGQNVDASSGTALAIADLGDVWVVADLFEDDVGALARGTKAQVLVGGATLEGAIDQVSAVVDPDRHTVPVRIRIANPDGLLRPNAYAQIRLFDPTRAKVALPASAVMSDGAQSYVYASEAGGHLRRRKVVTGPVSGGKVLVLDGVEPGEAVVMQGAILLDNQLELDN